MKNNKQFDLEKLKATMRAITKDDRMVDITNINETDKDGFIEGYIEGIYPNEWNLKGQWKQISGVECSFDLLNYPQEQTRIFESQNKQIMATKFLSLTRANQLEDSIGWLSKYIPSKTDKEIIGDSITEMDEIATTMLMNLGRLNEQRKDILDWFKSKQNSRE